VIFWFSCTILRSKWARFIQKMKKYELFPVVRHYCFKCLYVSLFNLVVWRHLLSIRVCLILSSVHFSSYGVLYDLSLNCKNFTTKLTLINYSVSRSFLHFASTPLMQRWKRIKYTACISPSSWNWCIDFNVYDIRPKKN
jgi:hypothetical protein